MKTLFGFCVVITVLFGGYGEVFAELADPLNLQVLEVGTGSVKVSWEWPAASGSGTPKRYTLAYKADGATEWTKVYPDVRLYQYLLTGLSEGTLYHWTLLMEGEHPSDNSNEIAGRDFATKSTPVGPGDGSGGLTIIDSSRLNPIKSETLLDLIGKAINIAFWFSLVIAPLMIIYGAFLMIQGAGTGVAKGRQVLIVAIIALVIIFLARGIPTIVQRLL